MFGSYRESNLLSESIFSDKQLHGRSRQQRYSKLADWDYIKQCATTLRESLDEANLPPVPIFGNGDCFSAQVSFMRPTNHRDRANGQGYYEEKEASGVDGIMVARGALIKPWIFTEIAERREWDISATERLEGIRKVSHIRVSRFKSQSDPSLPNTVSRTGVPALRAFRKPVDSSAKPFLSSTAISLWAFSRLSRPNSMCARRRLEEGVSLRRCWRVRLRVIGSRLVKCSWARARKGSTLCRNIKAMRMVRKRLRGDWGGVVVEYSRFEYALRVHNNELSHATC